MSRFSAFDARAVPLPVRNIDTDQIIPAKYLKVTNREGLGEGLFSRWRVDDAGEPRADFALNRPEYADAEILVAGDNFGCGSSREHAPWALLDYGFKAVISSGFADIFRNNSLKNGLLVIEVEPAVLDRLMKAISDDPETRIGVDLESRTLALPWGESISFEIDSFSRQCLLDGVDQLGYLVDRIGEIEAFEKQHPARVETAS